MEKIINFFKGNIENLFLFIAIPISIAYAICMLPLNVPDEGSHIMRAYDISQGNIFTKIDEDGNSYTYFLADLEDFSSSRFNTYEDIKNEMNKKTDYNNKTKMICAAQGNSPLLYVGTVLGLKIGQIFNINVIKAIYIARLFNVIIFLVLGYFSIKKIPFGKLILAICLCMPMMLQQAASCSADAILNACLIYYISFILYMVYKEEPFTKKDKIILYILTALIAMFKFVYILIAGILFAILFDKKRDKKESLKTIGLMILIGGVFAIGWYLFSARYKSISPSFVEYYKQANVSSSSQKDFVKNNPQAFVKVFIFEYLKYGIEYLFGAIGTPLGWLDVNINLGIIVLFVIILLFAAVTENSKYEMSTKLKIWILAILFVISTLIFVTMYIEFTPVGFKRICGIQGRYFTPVLFLIPMMFIKKENYLKVKNIDQKLILITFVLNILTLASVVNFYLG